MPDAASNTFKVLSYEMTYICDMDGTVVCSSYTERCKYRCEDNRLVNVNIKAWRNRYQGKTVPAELSILDLDCRYADGTVERASKSFRQDQRAKAGEAATNLLEWLLSNKQMKKAIYDAVEAAGGHINGLYEIRVPENKPQKHTKALPQK